MISKNKIPKVTALIAVGVVIFAWYIASVFSPIVEHRSKRLQTKVSMQMIAESFCALKRICSGWPAWDGSSLKYCRLCDEDINCPRDSIRLSESLRADSWKRPFLLDLGSQPPRIGSLGEDGVVGGTDEDADLSLDIKCDEDVRN